MVFFSFNHRKYYSLCAIKCSSLLFFFKKRQQFPNTPNALHCAILRKVYMSYGFEQNPYLIQIINSVAVKECLLLSHYSAPHYVLRTLFRDSDLQVPFQLFSLLIESYNLRFQTDYPAF